MAFVTIGIPTYNQPQYVKAAIDSALAQTYQDLEVIVSDDSTNDETATICQEYANLPNFKYFHNTPALGRVANYRHLLYDLAQSPFFLCLDGDDYLADNNYIHRAVQQLLEDEQKVLVFANSITYFQNIGRKIYDQNNGRIPDTCDGDWFFINFCQGFGMSHQTVLYNRQEAMKLDFYRCDIASSDWESFLRLVQGHRLGHQAEAVSVWRKHGTNETRHIALENILKNKVFIENAYEFAARRQVFSKRRLQGWRQKMLQRFYVKTLLQLTFTGQKEAGKKLKHFIRKNENTWLALKTTAHPLLVLSQLITPEKRIWHFILQDLLKMESFYYEFCQLKGQQPPQSV